MKRVQTIINDLEIIKKQEGNIILKEYYGKDYHMIIKEVTE